jgi:two-component system, NarL family, response regulator DevR
VSTFGSPVPVLLVEDHDMVRRALRELLTDGGDVEVIGEARTAGDGIREAVRLLPRVVLLDLRLPDGSGIDACAAIRAQAPDTQVLILTSHDDQGARDAAAAAGAAGYVLKELDPAALRQAIRDAAEGRALAG